MFDLELRDPALLVLALLAPIVFALARRSPATVLFSSLQIVRDGPRSLKSRLVSLPALLYGLAIGCLALAAAGPRSGDATTRVHREGIAIVMAVDRSGSMQARDFVADDQSVSRMDAVKDVFRRFVSGGAGEGRPNDLIGLVVFGTYADGVCPLTLDHPNLLNILEQTEVATERTEAATAVGEGLGLAVERLRGQKAKTKVVILLTDGVNNAGNIDPLEAADLAAAHGVKVYTIGAGTTGFAPMPVEGLDGRTYLRRVRVEIDEDTLREIAARTGGRYFHARNAEALAEVVAEIDTLERTDVTEVRYLKYTEYYHRPALAGLLLMMAGALLSVTVFRRLP